MLRNYFKKNKNVSRHHSEPREVSQEYATPSLMLYAQHYKKPISKLIIDRARKIKLVIFDVDGILTDGRLYFDAHGETIKVFHVQDGLGIKWLADYNIQTAIISGRSSTIVSERARKLHITHVYQGHEEKLPIFKELIATLNITPEEVAYIGDDILDLPLIRRVGLGITVPNAHPFVKQHAIWQTELAGGCGAAREVCDLILAAQGFLADIYQNYLP